MTEERTTPLRGRMIEDMRIRGLGDKSQQAHIRAVKNFAAFLGHSPDTATPEELRAYQLHMTDTEVTPSVYNGRITALRFFFGMTCGRDEMKRYMQFRTEPRKLPAVLSAEEVSELLAVAPGPGLWEKHTAPSFGLAIYRYGPNSATRPRTTSRKAAGRSSSRSRAAL